MNVATILLFVAGLPCCIAVIIGVWIVLKKRRLKEKVKAQVNPDTDQEDFDILLQKSLNTIARSTFNPPKDGKDSTPNDIFIERVKRSSTGAKAGSVADGLIYPEPFQRRRTQSTNPCEYRVWFGTDRRPIRDDDYLRGFTDDYARDLRFGSCVVQIPLSHEFASLGSPIHVRIVRQLIGKKADHPLKLLGIETGTQESFSSDLQECLQELPPASRQVLLFVHGFNVDFNAAAIRAAQIGKDLNIPGPMTFYSWPSKARTKAYTVDEATVDRTLPKFVQFIELLLRIPGLNALNIIAHSMGNRLVHRACLLSREIAQNQQLGHVILAASDIDRETFRQAAESYARLRTVQSRRMTIYYSEKDRALGASDFVHGDPRLGELGADIPGADSIKWISNFFDLQFLGHSYFAGAMPVLQDMRELLLHNKPPQERLNLKPIPSDVPLYWELRG